MEVVKSVSIFLSSSASQLLELEGFITFIFEFIRNVVLNVVDVGFRFTHLFVGTLKKYFQENLDLT